MTLAIVGGTFWLIGIAACVVAWRWSFRSNPKRFWPAIGLSILAIGIACLGLNRISLNWWETVNGRTQWRFDSDWFFWTLLVVAAATLAYALWKRPRGTPPGDPA